MKQLFLILFLSLIYVGSLTGQVPGTMAYNGYLTDASGAPISDDNATLTFRIYDEASRGDLLWTETRSGIALENGLFAVVLGTDESLTGVSFETATWMSVAIGDGRAEELAPRIPLTATPYSLRSRLLDDAALEAGENVSISRNEDQALVISAESSAGLTLPFAATGEITGEPAFEITNTGTGEASKFIINNPNSNNVAVSAQTNGPGAGLLVQSFGFGRAASFSAANNGNAVPTVDIITGGNGSVSLQANHIGTAGDIAVFQSNHQNQARIDKTGKGFFNGGTQNSGADVAEAFEVEGSVFDYEPGDVLIISTQSDRRVEKSSTPYSPLVVGVYATKPGVLLTARDLTESLDDTVPMGVIGVIPTKVTTENGPIRRGDLLVTSGTPGQAMKGTDRSRMLGAVIGKALQDFDGSTGVIQVMVNIQ